MSLETHSWELPVNLITVAYWRILLLIWCQKDTACKTKNDTM